MSTPAKLRIVLGADNCVKLTLTSGIPDSVDSLKFEIQKQCGIEGEFRLQYMDNDFDQFMNLTSTTDIQDKGTVKVIVPSEQSTQAPSHMPFTPFQGMDDSSADTDILSSSESTTSTSSPTSSLRSQGWPRSFPVPPFSYEVEMQLSEANQQFLAEGKRMNPSFKVRSDILQALASEIMKYTTGYPTSAQLDDVAEALIRKHPCLKEQGSATGYYGWKISLKFKMGNYRTKLRSLGCPEISINSMRNRQPSNLSSPNQVKKPRRAEVNFCPQYPVGEDRESLEKERMELLSEIKKRNNHQVIKEKMEKTFAHRRYEVVQSMPFIAEFKSRWPALFTEHEVSAEFMRITTIPLIPKFMSQLDHYYDKLTRVLRKKGGAAGRRITDIMAVIDQNDSIETRRACSLQAVALYLNEDPKELVKEYGSETPDETQRELDRTVIGIYVIKHPSAELPEDVGIIVEGVQVLSDIKDVATACALLFGTIYDLNLSYPTDLRYTFEFIQKILMELDTHRLSTKIQVLKNKLLE
ncbi:sterile alpha motif domain-containing protein 3-like [Centropristis striata]|uniref:sterile alpha motif domain-containing protein 3-like n=1 Tax=Centropristis striata TaxID=184440 RepID=UPI0027E1C967|nr:sterile alpha motif domain-containing protein 3-like [Centropristis striata]XP_059208219.1 sterile alpha motif domain-containing protein 3-like [Centropristis striata]XP_059208221.1 sterile alpha motif domain-containing protein 3-like [Centropristis striata]XP_059208222.1 sterile alpha motif domain-containing protein 3-like [Centropristis striata]XP_059208223.1 sterile alpha motif domain-containing protein 3-like [Centropristis striata]XP_059208224.1 sterile alpha motif domain-containing pr